MKDTLQKIRLTGFKIRRKSYIKTLSTFSKLGPSSLIIMLLILIREKAFHLCLCFTLLNTLAAARRSTSVQPSMV